MSVSRLVQFAFRRSVTIDCWRFFFLLALMSALSALGWLLATPGLPLFFADLPLLAPFLNAWYGRFAIMVSVTVTVIRIVQNIFGFDQMFVSSYLLLHNLTGFPARVTAEVSAAMLCLIGAIYLPIRFMPKRPIRANLVVVAIMLASLGALKLVEDRVKLNVIGTSFGYLFGSFKFASMFSDGYALPAPQGINSPSDSTAKWALEHDTNFLLIVVESMGAPNDASLRRELLAPFEAEDLRKRFQVESGDVPAKGSTIHGEIRELCGGHLLHGLLEPGNDHCLPATFKRHGYQTTAIHANHARMYGRNAWYPLVGFGEYVNADHGLPKAELTNRWGTLLDRDTLAHASSRLTQRRQFVYFLTVSTHLPAKLLPDASVSSRCEAIATDQACIHLANLRSVMEAIAKAAKDMTNTTVLVVGDHPPPFFSPNSKHAFSVGSVPFVSLRPTP